jgi:predicted outer membrane repeat protein
MADRYVKNSGSDAGLGVNWLNAFETVQKGIDDCAATGGGTVHVEFGYYPEVLDMRSDVELRGYPPGPGAWPLEAPSLGDEADYCPDKPVLDGGDAASVITCAGISNARIVNFNIVRGNGSTNGRGGGIYIQGKSIAVEQCCIILCAAADFGGGVCIDPLSTAIGFIDDLFWLNASKAGGGMAILGSDAVSVADCRFIQNLNSSTQGFGGGGIYVTGSDKISVDGSAFTANTSADNGGAILVNACNASMPSVAISRTLFTANTCKTTGGGIMVNASSFVAVTRSEFVDNHADTDGGGIGFNNVGLAAGGRFDPAAVRAAGQVSRITSCRFVGNGAGDDGGGVYLTAATMVIVDDTTLEQNTAENNGGGLHCTFGSAVDIEDSRFLYNEARQGHGGGVSLRNADLLMRGVELGHNAARNGMGGGIFTHTENAIQWLLFLRSWGFVARGGATAGIEACTITENLAGQGGGGVAALAPAHPVAVTVKRSTISNNRVLNAGPGGGIYLDAVTARLADSQFVANQVAQPAATARGGAVAAIACKGFGMTGGRVDSNRANFGAGIALKDIANPTIAGVTFAHNATVAPGGRGRDILTEACVGVTAAALLAANPNVLAANVVVVP